MKEKIKRIIRSKLIETKETIKRILCDFYESTDWKGILWAIAITIFIVLPMLWTSLSYLSITKESKLSSVFNLNSILVIAPLCSLIISNWKKDDKKFWEKELKLFCFPIFIAAITVILLLSVYNMILDGYYINKSIKSGIDVITFIHMVIFLICIFYLLDITNLEKEFNKHPNKLYAVLWLILLLTYIIYELIIKYLR